MIVLLLKNNANINAVDNKNETLFDKCLLSGNYELLELFMEIASFSKQPNLLFSFADIIYNPTLRKTFDYLMKSSKLSEKEMGILDDSGFTPFLRYLKNFCDKSMIYYQKISSYITYQVKKLKYEGAQDFSKESLKIYYDNYIVDEAISRGRNETRDLINRYQL